MGRFITPCILLLGLILLSCNNKQNERLEWEDSKHEVLFTKGVYQYSAAIKNGLRLDEPGVGWGPIEHRSLFTEYKKCFYLPAEVDPLISPQRLSFLEQKMKSSNKDETKLALICIEIIKSKRKIKRHSEFFEPPSSDGFKGELILYHYDGDSEDTTSNSKK